MEDIGAAVGVSHQAISKIERGGNTTVARLDALADALGAEAFATVYDPAIERVLLAAPEDADLLESLQHLPPRRRMLVERLAVVAGGMSDDVVGALLAIVAAAELKNRSRRAPGADAASNSK